MRKLLGLVVHPDYPQSAPVTDESGEVLARVGRLVQQSPDDEHVLAELRETGAQESSALMQALRASRLNGGHREYEHQNRVFRILDALVNRSDVAAMSDSDRRRIREIERVMTLSEGDRWREFTVREPRLCEVETEVVDGTYGAVQVRLTAPLKETGRTLMGPDGGVMREVISAESIREPPEVDEQLKLGRQVLRLKRRVDKLVGPNSSQPDLVMSSARAQADVMRHLIGTRS